MAEKRYIDAEIAAEMITRQMSADLLDYENDDLYRACVEGLEMARDIVRYVAEAADVAPVVHAEWNKECDCLSCSKCGYSFEPEGYLAFFKYCPNCGAKMDGGAEE